jgi:phytol kinase
MTTLGNLFRFFWIFGCVGFTLGTGTLQGPARWIVSWAREKGWSEDAEGLAVKAVILVLIVVSLVASIWIARFLAATETKHLRYGIPILITVFALAEVWLWMTPTMMQNPETAMPASATQTANFTFGAYPSENRLRELKEDGYTAVVTLLHPAVIPFEPKLLADEKKAAARVGIELIHLPMLPWIGENEDSLTQARKLAHNLEGRYYIHCYLGRDRIRLIQRVIEDELGGGMIANERIDNQTVGRTLESFEKFERGGLFYHEAGVWVTPYPTAEEFVTLMGAGNAATIVSLLDPENPDDARWLELEKQQFSSVGLPVEVRSLSSRPFDPEAAMELAKELLTMPTPVIVHAFLGADSGRAVKAEGLWIALATEKPPLPPSKFDKPLANGLVYAAAPNVAVGPTPTLREMGARLRPAGVRRFVYVGDTGTPAVETMRTHCRTYKMQCEFRASWQTALLDELADGGPWYLFGPGLPGDAGERIAELYGPAFPKTMRPGAWQDWLAERKAGRESLDSGRQVVHKREQTSDALDDAETNSGWRGFLARAIPSVRQLLLFSPFVLLWGAIAASIAGYLKMKRGMRTPYTRKVFHFLIFTSAGLIQWFGGMSSVVVFGCAVSTLVLYALWRGDGFSFYESMARETDAPRRSMFILIPLGTTALGGLLANIFFPAYAFIGYLVGGWGDAVGEPVGTRFGRHRYQVPSLGGVSATRSLEGSAAVFIVGGVAASAGLILAGLSFAEAFGVGIVCGLAGALVEAVSHHGLDNLTIQVTAAGVAAMLL